MRHTRWLFSITMMFSLFPLGLGCHSRDDVIEEEGVAGSNADVPAGDPVGGASAALDVEGTYAVESTLDVLKDVDALQDIVSDLEDMRDGEYDPASWLIDKALEELPLPGLEPVLALLRPTLDHSLNEVILALTPDILERLGALGADIGQSVKHFSMQSSLFISESEGALSAYHAVQAIRAWVQGQEQRLTVEALGFEGIQAGSIKVTLGEENAIVIGEHELTVPLGGLLLALLDRALIPVLDPEAHDLRTLLSNLLPCADLATGIEEAFPEISMDQFTQICRMGIVTASKYLEGKLGEVSEPVPSFQLAGKAQALDEDGDAQVDRLTGGHWRTMLTLGTLHVAVPDLKNPFEATRE